MLHLRPRRCTTMTCLRWATQQIRSAPRGAKRTVTFSGAASAHLCSKMCWKTRWKNVPIRCVGREILLWELASWPCRSALLRVRLGPAAKRPTTAASPTTAVTESAASGLLIYDGDCGFCTASARWYGARSGAGAIAPWQSLELGEYGLDLTEVSTAAYWVHCGQRWRGADGIAQALKACSGGWHFVGTVLTNPPALWIARLIYPVVALNRHRLPGSIDTCDID